jgi:hypothetical protein
MHPEVHEHEPGQCPICHMDLEPRAAGPEEAETSADDEATGTEAKQEPDAPTTRSHGGGGERGSKGAAAKTRPTPESKVPAPAPEQKAAVQYTCPMHPQVVKDAPGQCPICHMDLVEKKGGKQ